MKTKQKGFSLIELLLVIVIIGIVAAIAIPNMLSTRRRANESSAIGSVRTFIGAQATYKASNNRYGTFTEITNARLIDVFIACTTQPCNKSGYNYSGAPDATRPEFYWDIVAVPEVPIGLGSTGDRFFYSNEAGVIYANFGSLPTVDSSRTVTNGSPINQ